MFLALNTLSPHRTDRLAIRPLIVSDAGPLQALTDDPSITEAINFLSSPFSLADAEALIRSNDGENCFTGVWLNGALIGVVGAHGREGDRIEIGYWFGPAFHGRGFALEAVGALVGKLRQNYPHRQIVAECKPTNTSSLSLLSRLGFVRTERLGKRPGRELLVL